ncbi:MAG: hypothetical protein F6K24_31425, partial [Okeania sp. SIO2D1]|nr:hypothetical protein [Okeania sp. SIO2D1]
HLQPLPNISLTPHLPISPSPHLPISPSNYTDATGFDIKPSCLLPVAYLCYTIPMLPDMILSEISAINNVKILETIVSQIPQISSTLEFRPGQTHLIFLTNDQEDNFK